MTTNIVLTALGDDRPGLVEALAEVISAQGGNWQGSSMAQLAGKFAGLVHVSAPEDKVEALCAALAAFTPLQVVTEIAGAGVAGAAGKQALKLSLVGHDRIGIVREVSQTLARHHVNVEALNTFTSAAPMSGETLFHADASLLSSERLDVSALQADLEALSNELVVDISLTQLN